MLSRVSVAILPCLAGADQSLFSVATGRQFSFYIDQGKAYATGINEYGQLGINTGGDSLNVFTEVPIPEATLSAMSSEENATEAPTEAPTPAPPPARLVKQIAAGAFHTLFLLTNGEVYATGRNHYGQLGDGTTAPATALRKVDLSGVQAVAAGYAHSVFLVKDDANNNTGVWTVGHNSAGQLGHDQPTTKPERVIAAEASAIAAGYDFTFGVVDGKVHAAGQNNGGQLGLPDRLSRAHFTEVAGLSDVTSVAAGESHALFKTSTDKVFGTGASFDGQLTGDSMAPVSTPKDLGISGVQLLGAGGDSSCLADWQLKCFGSNRFGQLGLGNQQTATSPTAVEVATGLDNGMDFADGIALADSHSVFLNHAVVVATGTNGFGQLGDGSVTDATVAKKIVDLERAERTTTTLAPTPAPTSAPPPVAPTPAPSPGTTRDIQNTPAPGTSPDYLMIILGVSVALAVVLLLVSLARGGNSDAQADVEEGTGQQEDLELIRGQMSMN